MKKILLISLSLLFAGEMEVDGDLNVTGTIQSQTIDSLLQVIADLQSQLNALQGGMTSKIISFPLSIGGAGDGFFLPISEVLGYDLDRGTIEFIGFEGEIEDYIDVVYWSSTSQYGFGGSGCSNFLLNHYTNAGQGDGLSYFFDSNVDYMSFDYQGNSTMFFDGVLYFMVTAQFSDADVQLRKTGLQSKDKKTVK